MIEPTLRTNVKAVSWGSIIAGTVTVVSVLVLLSLLVSGIGIGMVDPTQADPAGGVGTTFGIGGAITLIIALAAGGFVAGHLAGQTGLIHGFLTWATSMVVVLILTFSAVSTAVSWAGSAIGTTLGAAGSAAGTVASGIADATTGLADQIDLSPIAEVDFNTAASDLQTALDQSGIEALSTANLQSELAGAREDVNAALVAIRNNPSTWDTEAQSLIDSLAARVEGIAAEIDRDQIVTAISENTTLTPAQADEAADEAIAIYTEARDQAVGALETFEQTLVAARTQLQETQAALEQAAADAAAATSQSALWAFFASLIGAVIASAAGVFGLRTRPYDRI